MYYQPRQILSITALDLSEDKTILSTKNDEIMVSIFHLYKVNDDWVANGYHLPIHIFDSTSKTFFPKSDTFITAKLHTENEIWICLTEIDEDSSEDSTHRTLLQLINSKGYNALDSKSTVDAEIHDNDFLGYIRLPVFASKLQTEYIIQGQDLFDKYKYELIIKTHKTTL